jgi:hypothetical protein
MSQEQAKIEGKASLFKPGQSGNPAGKPKGAPNKITTLMRETFAALFEDNIDQIKVDLKAVEAKDRLRFWIDLAPYFVPKLTATKAEITVRSTGLEHLSQSELTEFVLEITSTNNNESDE